MKKKRPAKRAPTVTRDIKLHVVAQFSKDGLPLGEPVAMAKAKLLYVGAAGSDDPLGPQYVLGVIEPLCTKPPVAFSEEGMDLLYSNDTHLPLVEHVMGLAGKEVRWGDAVKFTKGTVVRGVDEKKRRAGKVKRGKS